MLKILVSIVMFSFSCLAMATESKAPLYQIDLIVFTHQQDTNLPAELSLASSLPVDISQAIALQTDQSKGFSAYHTLPPNASQLRQEYWALNRKSDYRVLLHYSWLQPFNSQRPVALPRINKDGWQLEGTVRVRRSNYYLLDTNLVFSKSGNQNSSFAFNQKQRLKGGDTYYLDHPGAGILIKVHQVG